MKFWKLLLVILINASTLFSQDINLLEKYNGDFELGAAFWRFFEVPTSMGSSWETTDDAINGDWAMKLIWNAADGSVQNLLSGGLGTITHTPVEYDTIQVATSWANGVWQVAFSRSMLGTDPDYQYDMSAGDSALEVSFGTWDGGKQMRNGMKWISGIERMDIDP